MKHYIILTFFLTIALNSFGETFQNKLVDSSRIENYLKDSSYFFVTGEIVDIKKEKYYLNRWHNFTEKEFYIIKVRIIDKLTSGHCNGQILIIATDALNNNGFEFKNNVNYFITCKRLYTKIKVKGKYKSFPWTDKNLPTKKLSDAESEIEKIKNLIDTDSRADE
jgi:hypothetical protein